MNLAAPAPALAWDRVYCLEASDNEVNIRFEDQTGTRLKGTLTYVLSRVMPLRNRSAFVRINGSVLLREGAITHHTAEWVYCGEERWENTRYRQ